MLKYKGYTGVVQFDDEVMIFHGEVTDLRDVITFHGTTSEEIKKAFEKAINGYLDWCKELGQEPEKPFSGLASEKKHQTYLENLAKVDLDKVKGLKRASLIKELIDPDKTAYLDEG